MFLTSVTSSLTRLPFSKRIESSQDLEYLATLSKKVLWSFVRWQEKYPDEASLSRIAPMASVTAFVVLTFCFFIRKQYDSFWWMGILLAT